MQIIKVFNNNVVSSTDEKNREIMVLGKGIGFQKKPGEAIDESKVEKIFRLPSDIDPDRKSHFQSLVEEIPYEYIKYTNEIVKRATEVLGKKLNRNIYITLT
ncbi:MAG: transcription antiterminator BglG, partial [Lachnospiraceae bacterium]|nr:transcription antiterminator BglG [Lachnospiraceae bacterium]